MNSKPIVAAVALAIGALTLAACDRQEMNAKTDRAVARATAATMGLLFMDWLLVG